MTKEELRTRIEAELLCGEDAGNLSKKYDAPYVTILGWKKKLLAEKQPEDISDLTSQTKASLEIIKTIAKEQAPTVANKIDAIVDGIEGLKELEPEFQKAMHTAVTRAQSFLDDVDDEGVSTLSIKEWQIITATLASAYTALFNKSGTTVNVAQTNVNAATENLSFFKASQKKI